MAEYKTPNREILDAIEDLNHKYSNIVSNLDMKYSEIIFKQTLIEEKIENMKSLLDGNGDPEKSIIIKIDRLQQKANTDDTETLTKELTKKVTHLGLDVDRLKELEKNRNWIIKALTTASIGAIAACITAWFKHS
jgi:hypothetical protein